MNNPLFEPRSSTAEEAGPNITPTTPGDASIRADQESASNGDAPFTLDDTNALFDYVRKLSPRRLTVLTGLFLAAVAALLVIKMLDEDQARRTETELRLARTVQNGAASMNIDIMTGLAPGTQLGQDLPPGAVATFYHLSENGSIIATAGPESKVSLDPLTIATLPLDINGSLILDFAKQPIAASWQALDNDEYLMAVTPARDMFLRQPLWIGYAVLLGAITLLSASLMRAFIRQNAAAYDAAEALSGFIRINDALKNGRCCPWYFNELTRKVLLSRSLLEPLGLGARDRYFSLQELTSLIHPKDLRAALGIFTGEKKGVFEGVARLRRAGGGWSQIMIRTDAQATRRHRSGIAFDISDIELGQQLAPALTEADKQPPVMVSGSIGDYTDQLRDGINTIPDALVLWDDEGKLLCWNKRFASLFRFPAGNDDDYADGKDLTKSLTVGLNAEEVIDRAGGGKDIIRQYFCPEAEVAKASVEVGLSGDRWVRIMRRTTEQGGVVCLASNITDQKRRARAYIKRERQLERTVADLEKSRRELSETTHNYALERRRAEDASRSKSEFLANMSHELRTPLNAINGFSEVMQSELYGPLGNGKYKEYVDDIHTSGRHLLELIDDILDMSRIEAGRLQLDAKRIELDRILNESIRLVTRRADEAAVTFTASVNNAPPIWADQRATKQVILNLLANALKFTAEGGSVKLVTEADLDSVSILIIDTGTGIAPDHLTKLGNPFEMGETEFAKSRQGSGLGLALSKSLMEMQGGLLALASQSGKGTIACATFPRRDGAKVRLPQSIRKDAYLLTDPTGAKRQSSQSPSMSDADAKVQKSRIQAAE